MKERNNNYDIIRGIAILFVLIIHSSMRFNVTPFEISVGEWLSTFTRPCIAIFLFLSGYLYFSKNNSVKKFFNRIKRIIIPYLFFSILALIFIIFVQNTPLSVTKVVINLLVGNTFGIYYYVFVIIVIYISTFVLEYFNLLDKHLVPIVLISFVLNIVHNAFFDYITTLFGLSDSLIEFIGYRSVFIWFFFFYLGVLFKRHNLSSFVTTNKTNILIAWFMCFIIYNVLWFFDIGNTDGYTSVIGTIYSLMSIFLLMSINFKKNRFFQFLGIHSYTIYLSHIFFVYLLVQIETNLQTQFPAYFNLLSFIFSLLGSVAIIYISPIIFKEKTKMFIG